MKIDSMIYLMMFIFYFFKMVSQETKMNGGSIVQLPVWWVDHYQLR
jgi:hypothetical protein